MKLLIYQWNSYLQYDICEICKEKNISYELFEWKFQNKNCDVAFQEWFIATVDHSEYDAVLSVNYYPVISEACMKKDIKYIAWCYDNPLNVENIEDTLNNPVNYVFLFDKIQFWNYVQKGFETVYHLPLGVNRSRFLNFKLQKSDYKKYNAEVSFVGNLYESRVHELLAPMNEYTKGYLKSLMNLQSQVYGYYLFDELITEEVIENVNSQYIALNPDTKFKVSKAALAFAMASEVTRNERLILLNLCGRRYDTRLYSYDKSDLIKDVINCGSVDYVTEMPKVFACSKINLNPTLRMIQTGIPLRAFDIMASGGFLMSNYQEELMEYFENEEDMVIYESIEDALDKIKFYLSHEELRSKIAENGRRKTLEEHSLQECMEKILNVVGL